MFVGIKSVIFKKKKTSLAQELEFCRLNFQLI